MHVPLLRFRVERSQKRKILKFGIKKIFNHILLSFWKYGSIYLRLKYGEGVGISRKEILSRNLCEQY